MVGVTDANGNPITDASGNPVTQLVTTVTPVAVPVTDDSGNAVTGNISSDIIFIKKKSNIFIRDWSFAFSL